MAEEDTTNQTTTNTNGAGNTAESTAAADSPQGWRGLVQTLRDWPLSRKLSLAAVGVITLALFAVLILQARQADYRTLFSDLSKEDASQVVQWLDERQIPYKITNNGNTIKVPADQVYDTRIRLAGEGIPSGGGVGFEIFDKQSFGITDFAQQVNYQRALQGELSRTVASLEPVDSARVHLALPEKRVFKRDQENPSASVIVGLAQGRDLKEGQVNGIVNLVSSSIEGMEPENVSVVDESGRVLTERLAEADSPLSPRKLEYQRAIEKRLERRAQSLLDRALGPQNALVRVTAEIDFSEVEKVEEKYDPDSVVPRSEQIMEQESGGEVSGGVPGVESNLENGQGGQTTTGMPSSRTEETINYEISKTINRIQKGSGGVERLSVAVLVAETKSPEGEEGDGGRSQEQLNAIRDMVVSALGLNTEDRDQIEVVSMPFARPRQADMAQAETTPSFYKYLPYVKYGLLALGAIALYFLLVRPLLKVLRGETEEHYKTVEEMEAEMGQQEEADPTQKLRKEILEAQASPVQVIRHWLNEEES